MSEDYPNDFEELAHCFDWALILFATGLGCGVGGSLIAVALYLMRV